MRKIKKLNIRLNVVLSVCTCLCFSLSFCLSLSHFVSLCVCVVLFLVVSHVSLSLFIRFNTRENKCDLEAEKPPPSARRPITIFRASRSIYLFMHFQIN